METESVMMESFDLIYAHYACLCKGELHAPYIITCSNNSTRFELIKSNFQADSMRPRSLKRPPLPEVSIHLPPSFLPPSLSVSSRPLLPHASIDDVLSIPRR